MCKLTRVCYVRKALEETGLAPNSLGGGLSRRARSCGKCAIKAFARRFAGSRWTGAKLLESPSGSDCGSVVMKLITTFGPPTD